MSRPFQGEAPSSNASMDWLDEVLLRDASNHDGDYISDNGFTARVMAALPAAESALPAWRRPVVILLWIIAGAFIALALPGVAVDVARAAYTLFSARPFSLSTLAFMLIAVGAASWTAAVVTLRD